VYVDGYDWSGFARSAGPLELIYDEADLTAPMADTVKGYLPNQAQVNVGTINAVFDNTATTGIHALGSAGVGASRNVLVAIGIRAAPAAGDPCFGGSFLSKGYQTTNENGALTITEPFSGWAANIGLLYAHPFGQLLHENAAVTAANTAVGFDNVAGATSTACGGYMVYHVLASSNASHTATIKVQDAATNTDPSFADLSGATTGSITVTAGVSGIVFLSNTATVRRYLRWQITLGTATSVTFLLGFFRGWAYTGV
jgi:hypothetical protein